MNISERVCVRVHYIGELPELALTGPKRSQHEIYFQPVKMILHALWVPVPIITNASRERADCLDQGGERNGTVEKRRGMLK